MFLKIYVPPYPLRQYVKSMIHYRDYSAETAFEKLLPDGNAQLIVELDGNYRKIRGRNQESNLYFRKAWITGIQTNPVTYHSEQHASTLCIQFETGGLHALLGTPLTEVSNKMIDASLLLGKSIIQLREYLLECEEPSQVFTAASIYLENMLTSLFKPNCLILNHIQMVLYFKNSGFDKNIDYWPYLYMKI